ncbi:hypothetical protein DSO57_1002962 [Entomophthora muscae]|uniref:Uncharacterized protein n=1 Tax=Entomophthora muscae TaxID=34485 RepID=A0ACC2U748_9FUNG|nr:hypothetical protein DSO57_1002962 [Entomophthora muscae]
MNMYISGAIDFVTPQEYGTHNDKFFGILDMIVHELSHGLGFITLINHYVHEYHTNPNDRSHDGGYIKLNPRRTLFDTFIYLHNTSGLATTQNSYNALSSLNIPSIEQRNSIYFQTKYGTKVNLATDPKIFSASHYDRSYKNTTDFNMIDVANQYNHTLKFQNITSWKTSPIGPKTIEIFETLGYKRNPNPSRAKSLISFIEKMGSFNKNEGGEKNM